MGLIVLSYCLILSKVRDCFFFLYLEGFWMVSQEVKIKTYSLMDVLPNLKTGGYISCSRRC